MIDDRELDRLVREDRAVRRFMRGFGWFMIALGLVCAAWWVWTHGPALPAEPLRTTAAAAHEGDWFALEGFVLDCASEKRIERWGTVAVGRQGATPILVGTGPFRCEDAPPRLDVLAVGLTAWQREQLTRVGLAAETQDIQLLLRTDQGRDQLRNWPWALTPGLWGLLLLFLGRRRDARRAAAPPLGGDTPATR